MTPLPIQMPELKPCPFVVGNKYQTQSGRWVKFIGVSREGTSYETMFDEEGVHRYTGRDFGRVTGSNHDYSHPENTPPIYTRAASVPSDKERAEIYPNEIGVVKFKDGTYDVFPDQARIAPSVTYIREDSITAPNQSETIKVLVKALEDNEKELQLIADDAYCDHTVGVCSCEYWRVREQNKQVITQGRKALGM